MKKGKEKFFNMLRCPGQEQKKEGYLKKIVSKTALPVGNVKTSQMKEKIPNDPQVANTRRRVIKFQKGNHSLNTNAVKRKVLYKKIFHEIFADSQKKVLLFFMMNSLTALGFCRENKSYAILLLALTISLLKPAKLLRLYKEFIQSKAKREKRYEEELKRLRLSEEELKSLDLSLEEVESFSLEELEDLNLRVQMLADKAKEEKKEDMCLLVKRALQDNECFI